MKTGLVAIAASALGMLAGTGRAATVTYGFECLTNSSATNAATGAAQLTVKVSSSVAGVSFEFNNSGPNASSICQIYFDETTLFLGGATITPSAGVSFSINGSPPNLPAGNTASPAFASTIRYTADSPVQPNGVNPGESLLLDFALLTGSANDVLSELASGALRIGIHVQGFADGGSESFLTGDPVNVIPLPTASAMGLAGLAALSLRRRR